MSLFLAYHVKKERVAFGHYEREISEVHFEYSCLFQENGARRGGGGDLNSSMPGCVCPKVKDMGPFLASSE